MEGNDDILEENNMFISERDSESTNDTCEDIQKFSSTIKFVGLMNEEMEALVDSLPDHLSSWNKLSVKFMKNILKIISLN